MRPTKIMEKTLKYKGHNYLISAILYNDTIWVGTYEIGVFDLDDDFREIELDRATTPGDCQFYFDKFVKKYTEKKVSKENTPIPERYLKFAEDYNIVYNRCKQYFIDNPITDDGSASNFDSCIVEIGKKVRKGFLEAALRPYKLKCTLHNGLIFVAVPYTQYQGNGNTIQAEFMADCFKKLGHKSGVLYRVD